MTSRADAMLGGHSSDFSDIKKIKCGMRTQRISNDLSSFREVVGISEEGENESELKCTTGHSIKGKDLTEAMNKSEKRG